MTRVRALVISIVLFPQLEVGLGMGADGAHLGGFFAHDDMTAVAALPHLDAALFEDLLHLDVL